MIIEIFLIYLQCNNKDINSFNNRRCNNEKARRNTNLTVVERTR